MQYIFVGPINNSYLQYYVRLGDARFIDLGLGTQRVKCEVHKDFK